ncbi:MAG: RluA family pseudouridine synthase [Verrucomicrobiaceae bacterium]|nr:RluA family pseudouridine synthase [Verrucomicrobiaceae bacterium]
MNLDRTVSEPSKLLPHLFTAYPEVQKTKVRQWLKFSGVHVNGQPITRHDHELEKGDRITIQPPKAPARVQQTPLPSGLSIVHEDDDLIVLEKGAGWLTIAKDNGKGRNVYSVLTDYVRSVNPRLKVWIVHRLDRDTSGLIVFAKNEEAKHWLQDHWQDFEKRYLAVVEGSIATQSGTLRSFLDESNPLRVRSAPPSEETREAITHYRVVRQSSGHSLIELTLETGRRHQIRVQLSDARCPVVGDERYGAKKDPPASRLALHAAHLHFQHPRDGREMTFESPLPAEMAKMMSH